MNCVKCNEQMIQNNTLDYDLVTPIMIFYCENENCDFNEEVILKPSEVTMAL